MEQYLPLLGILVVMYFFIIAPQLKKAKQEKNFANELKRGKRIITKSGLYGKIIETNDKDNTCVIETMAGKLKFDRSAISMEMSKKLKSE